LSAPDLAGIFGLTGYSGLRVANLETSQEMPSFGLGYDPQGVWETSRRRPSSFGKTCRSEQTSKADALNSIQLLA
jgi:hypothetical protein